MGKSGGHLLDDLNPEQRRAVTQTEGPVLVLAGAGSGKTRVITRRIGYLLSKGVIPKAVLAVTFTNKAAREMRERVSSLVGAGPAKELTVSTFHSFCARTLRQNAEAVGLSPRFAICDDSDQLTAVKGALRELRVPEATLHPRAALSKISLLKNKLVSPEKALSDAVDNYDVLVARAFKSYNSHLGRSRTVDFDDLLLLAGRLLAGNTAVRKKFQDRYRYLMVDEYQDTNGAQYEILRHLAGTRRNLCVVGDDDQSIYGWRGADVRKILAFEKDFPKATVIRLETNYRSTEPILEAANKVIRHNRSRHEKTLKAFCGPGEPVRVLDMAEEEHEAEYVVSEISYAVRHGKAKYGDYAILFRTQTQPRAFEARLRASRVPYDLVGGMSFFDRKEVRDILSYLRVAANPDDETSLLRVVNVPPRGVGKASIDKILEFATKEGISAGAAFDRTDGMEGISPAAVAAVGGFRQRIAGTMKRITEVGMTAAIGELLLALDYKSEVTRCYPDPVAFQSRWAAVEEILNMSENHVRRTKNPTLDTFLEELVLSTEEREETPDGKPRDVVSLMTLHAAKGLEFPRVYLVGVEEGILPHHRSIAEETVEEERRLMYVGITRARKVLTITRALTRAKYGRREACLPSRFLFELKGETPPPAPAPAKPETQPKKRKIPSRKLAN